MTKEEKAAYAREWRKRNPDYTGKAWEKWRAANPEKAKESARKALRNYKAKHGERIRERQKAARLQNPERAKKWTSRWVEKNRDKVNARAAAYRARMAKGRVSADEWSQVLAESGGVCAYCARRRKLSVDHIEPLSKGGEHSVSNLVSACGSCNSAKRNKSLLYWLATRRAA